MLVFKQLLGEGRLAAQMRVPISEARKHLRQFSARFREASEFKERVQSDCSRQDMTVRTLLGRQRWWNTTLPSKCSYSVTATLLSSFLDNFSCHIFVLGASQKCTHKLWTRLYKALLRTSSRFALDIARYTHIVRIWFMLYFLESTQSVIYFWKVAMLRIQNRLKRELLPKKVQPSESTSGCVIFTF